MDERITSGDDGLDRILGGGLPMNGINLIMGATGLRKDDSVPAVHLRVRDRKAPGALPVHGLGAL